MGAAFEDAQFPDMAVSLTASEALGRIGPRAVAAVEPALEEKKPGDKVKLTVRRGRGEAVEELEIPVVLGRKIR